VSTLDLSLPHLPRLNFLKIDVEGMEFEVLSGARELLRRFKPKVYFESSMDFEIYRRAPVRKAAAELLGEMGYRFFTVHNGKRLREVAYPNFPSNTFALLQ
jgi:hypothetical protein